MQEKINMSSYVVKIIGSLSKVILKKRMRTKNFVVITLKTYEKM